MSDAEIVSELRLLRFVEPTGMLTPAQRRYLWALEEIQRLRAALAGKA